jgi:hypothetical protein
MGLYNPQWTPEERERALRENARAQTSQGLLNMLPAYSRMEIEYVPPKRGLEPDEHAGRYRMLRTAYHARAWR